MGTTVSPALGWDTAVIGIGMIRYMIQDSMHEVFRRLGHLAEIMHSKDDVVRELPCLAFGLEQVSGRYLYSPQWMPFKIQPWIWLDVRSLQLHNSQNTGRHFVGHTRWCNTNLRNIQSAKKRKFKGPSLGQNEDAICSVTGYVQANRSAFEYEKYYNAICNGSFWTVRTSH